VSQSPQKSGLEPLLTIPRNNPNTLKPVPLSSLEDAKRKSDPKIQTSQNVNDLKNALAAALKKGPNIVARQEEPKPENSLNTVPEKSPQSPQSPQSPREVPEDILKKVLKVE